MTYMSVERPTIQQAFALAHRAGQNPDVPQAERVAFARIAHLIWDACGEAHVPKVEVTAEQADALNRIASDVAPQGWSHA